MFDTHFHVGEFGENRTELVDVPLPGLIGQPGGLGERLILEVSREEWLEVRDITRLVDGDTVTDELLLVGHSGCVRFVLVELASAVVIGGLLCGSFL